MADENNMVSDSSVATVDAPIATATPDTPTATQTNGDGKTPAEVQEAFEKIDPNKLNPSDLKIYKHYQRLYTKARQKDVAKLNEFNQKLEESEKYSNDPDVKAILEYRRTGKLPEGHKFSFEANLPPDDEIGDTTRFVDPEVLEIKGELNTMKEREFEREKDAALVEVNTFIKELKDIDPENEQLYLKLAPQMKVLIDSMRGTGYTNREKLEKAWYAHTGKEMFEKGKQSAWKKFQQKKDEPTPENNSAAQSVKADAGSSISSAFDEAVRIHGGG